MLLRLSVIVVLVCAVCACGGCGCGSRKEEAPPKQQARTLPDKKPPAVKTVPEIKPPPSPWKQLPDMDVALARFALATDGDHVYRLGGVDFDITVGQQYGRGVARYDVAANEWVALPPAPFGTGNALLNVFPNANMLVAIAGVDKLGDPFKTEGVTLGVLRAGANTWRVVELSAPGLGRPDKLIWLQGDTALLLTMDAAVDKGRSVALLDLWAMQPITRLADFPIEGRMVGAAKLGDTLYVLQQGQAPVLMRFDLTDNTWQEPVQLDEFDEPVQAHLADLFGHNGTLYLWVNSPADDYSKKSVMYRIDPDTGAVTRLHPEHPGPPSRRNASAILVGSRYYIFGGQQQADVHLCDVWRYDLR